MTESERRPAVTVYTVLFNDYDHLMPAPRGDRVRAVCITDREPAAPLGWDVRIVSPSPLHPFAQRAYKIMSHLVFPEADVTLYLDANLTLKANPVPLVNKYLSGSDFALFRHPQRDSIYDEIDACVNLRKDGRDQLAMLAHRYRRLGVPDRGFLHACGFLLRRHSQEIRRLNSAWFEELLRSSIRDQPALGYALWTTGTTPSVIDADIWHNDVVSWTPHTSRVFPRRREYLFVGGNPRSGTTALVDLLNSDPRIVVGKERYRKVRGRLSPAHFLSRRFFAPTQAETSFLPARLIPEGAVGLSVWPEDEDAVKEKWESPRLRYVGDKAPFYVRQLGYLRRVFPRSRLVVLLRDPVGVAASYQRRADDPSDHWPSENGHELAIEHWNESIANVLSHIASHGIHDLFLVEYESFYAGDLQYLRSLYQYLDMDLSPEVEAYYERMTQRDERRSSQNPSLTAEAERQVRAGADWTGYTALRRLVPLMRDYSALKVSRLEIVAAEQQADAHAREYRALFDLSRRLFNEVEMLGIGDHADAAVEETVARVRTTWRSHWGGIESIGGPEGAAR